jgi:two-component system, response regulator
MFTSSEAVEVLLVEDQAADAQLILRALRSKNLGDNVLWVRDGAAALDFLLRTGAYAGQPLERLPKVVMLDVKLPKVDGIEVLQTIRGTPRLKTIPVVMLTSSLERSDIARSYAGGANSYILKPVDFDQLIDAVSTTIVYWMLYNHVAE